jgi:hypothetical protein
MDVDIRAAECTDPARGKTETSRENIDDDFGGGD